MTVWQWLTGCYPAYAMPMSTERPGAPSRSELRRWLQKGSIVINESRLAAADEMPLPVHECVFHPKGKRRCTVR